MARYTVALLCALLAPALAVSVLTYHEPDGVNVEVPETEGGRSALCASFERVDGATWRTEAGATLTAQRYDAATDDFTTVNIKIPPSDIGETHAFDLFWSIEGACPHHEATG